MSENIAFKKWKKGFLRKCSNSGLYWYCDPKKAVLCCSSDNGIAQCVSGGSCDDYWRNITGYRGKMLKEYELKEEVEFT